MKKLFAVALASVALAVSIVGPASAYSMNGDEMTGKYGKFLETVDPDVVCVYNQTTHLLARMKVNPPQLWGTYDQATTVGWRYEIRSQVDFSDGILVSRSGTWRNDASLTQGSAFKASIWRPKTALVADTYYYARYKFFWYAPGSKSVAEGKVIATASGIGNRMKMGDQHVDSITGCLGAYPG